MSMRDDPGECAPVALFAYDRADHLAATISCLAANDLAERTDLYVFIDGPKDSVIGPRVEAVRKTVHQAQGFRAVRITERSEHWGLRRSLIDGISAIASEHERVIVLEDDIVTNPGFLVFMNAALEFYRDYHAVCSVSGYLPACVSREIGSHACDTFFHYRPVSWGWATWWDRWKLADWQCSNWQAILEDKSSRAVIERGGSDLPSMIQRSMEERNQSWMARWYFNCCLHGMVTLYPGRSLVDNIGFDGTGTHGRGSGFAAACERYRVRDFVNNVETRAFRVPVFVDDRVHRIMKRFFDPPWYANSVLLRRIYAFLKRTRGWTGGDRKQHE